VPDSRKRACRIVVKPSTLPERALLTIRSAAVPTWVVGAMLWLCGVELLVPRPWRGYSMDDPLETMEESCLRCRSREGGVERADRVSNPDVR